MWKCPACRSLLAEDVVARAAPDDVCPVCNFEPLRNAVLQPPPADDDPTWPVSLKHAWSVLPVNESDYWLSRHAQRARIGARSFYTYQDAQAVADWLNERDAGYPPRPGLMP